MDRSAARRAAEAARRLLVSLARPLPAPFLGLARAEEPTGLAGVEVSWLEVSPFGMPPRSAAPGGGGGGAAPANRSIRIGAGSRPGRPGPGPGGPRTALEGTGLGGRRAGERPSGVGTPRSAAPPLSAAAAGTGRAPAAPGGAAPRVREPAAAGDAASVAGPRAIAAGAAPAAGSSAPAPPVHRGGAGGRGERKGIHHAPEPLAGAAPKPGSAAGSGGDSGPGGQAAPRRAVGLRSGAAATAGRPGPATSAAGGTRVRPAPGDAAAAHGTGGRLHPRADGAADSPLVPALPRIGALAAGLTARRPAAAERAGAPPRPEAAPAPEPVPDPGRGVVRRGLEAVALPAATHAAPAAPAPETDSDHLASLVNDALVEQARRHGIDLS